MRSFFKGSGFGGIHRGLITKNASVGVFSVCIEKGVIISINRTVVLLRGIFWLLRRMGLVIMIDRLVLFLHL